MKRNFSEQLAHPTIRSFFLILTIPSKAKFGNPYLRKSQPLKRMKANMKYEDWSWMLHMKAWTWVQSI